MIICEDYNIIEVYFSWTIIQIEYFNSIEYFN